MPAPALSAKNMSIKFGSKTILDNISIDIHAGQVTTLLGPNGAGKSTLLKALCRELSSNADIEYFGHSMTKWSPQRLATAPRYAATK